MRAAREAIYTAFYNQISQAVGFNTISRTPIPEAKLGTARLPALEILDELETPSFRGLGIPLYWTLQITAQIYVDTGDNSIPGYAVINAMLDAIDVALRPDPATGRLALKDANGNEIAVDCRFSGSGAKDPGYQSGIGVAGIRIDIITTS
jgi:hypothetical protein